ncbi:MAG: ABC transporter ATP-binding protein [Salinibacterium sp.]|nr:ABC transporter ATP-binding protein [Salinibacterium sp.]
MFASVRLSLGFLTKRELVSYVLFVFFRALTGVLDVLGIVLIGAIAGIGASQLDTTGKPLTVFGITLPVLTQDTLLLLVLGVLGIFVIKAALAISLSRGITSLIASIESRNADIIAEYLLRGSLDSAKQYSKAQLQWAITGSITYTFTGLINNVATLITEGSLLVLIAGAFFLVDPVAAVAVLVYFAFIVFIIQVVIGRSLKKAGLDSYYGTVETTNSISDTLDTFREISVLAKQQIFIESISTSRAKIARSGGTMTFLSGMPRYVIETALILGVVIFVGQLFLTGQLASGIVTVGVFLTGGVRIMSSLLPVQSAVASMKNNAEQASLAQKILVQAGAPNVPALDRTRKPEIVHAEVLPAGGMAVSLDSVRFSYPGDEHDTIVGVTMEIVAGQHVAIIGPSGAGKTTLVDLVLGLVTPTEGTITIGGESPRDLREIAPGAVGYVPQKPGLVSGTIAQNIALGVRPEDVNYDRINEVVEAAYLTEFIASLPDGVHTSVGAQVDSLSGGQIQRLGVARALYPRPKLLVLDEATSGLDAGSEAFVSASLSKLGKDVTVIIIAHRLSTVQHSDVVHVVEAGQVTHSGKFSALRKSVPMVAEYVKLMSFDDK